MITERAWIHGTDVSGSFQTIAGPPPGLRTRAISMPAQNASNQWNARTTLTASTHPSFQRDPLGGSIEYGIPMVVEDSTARLAGVARR